MYLFSLPCLNLPPLIWTCQVLFSEVIIPAELSQNLTNTHTHLQVDIYITSDLYNVAYSGESFLSIWHVKANCPRDERYGSLNSGAGIRDKQTWLHFVSVLCKRGGKEGQ